MHGQESSRRSQVTVRSHETHQQQQHGQRYLNNSILVIQQIFTVAVLQYTTVKPKFTVTPEDVDAQDGSSARLNCQVIGNPRPVITWTFNDGPVDRQRTGTFD